MQRLKETMSKETEGIAISRASETILSSIFLINSH